MARYDKNKDEVKVKTQVLEDYEDDTEKTQELDQEENTKEGKKEHWELDEGHDVRRRENNVLDELDMKEIIMSNARPKVMIKVLIGALVILGVLLIYFIFKTFSYKSEIKDLLSQLNELNSAATQNSTDTKEEDNKEKLSVMTYDKLNSILLKFSEPTVNENSKFQPNIENYSIGPQRNSVSYLVKYLSENNKVIPEMKGLNISNKALGPYGKDLCLIAETIAPIKMKEFLYQTEKR